jgi:hypothetical protein
MSQAHCDQCCGKPTSISSCLCSSSSTTLNVSAMARNTGAFCRGSQREFKLGSVLSFLEMALLRESNGRQRARWAATTEMLSGRPSSRQWRWTNAPAEEGHAVSNSYSTPSGAVTAKCMSALHQMALPCCCVVIKQPMETANLHQ